MGCFRLLLETDVAVEKVPFCMVYGGSLNVKAYILLLL